ncbi:28744_t:CDS:2, partial [Racocetra persica]
NSETNLYSTRYNVVHNNEANVYNIMNDNKANIENYYKEVYRSSIDIKDPNMSVDAITIKKDDSFSDFNDTEQYIKYYSEFKRFKIRLGRSTMIDTENEKSQNALASEPSKSESLNEKPDSVLVLVQFLLD